jgi:hypothetical protein
MGAVQANILNRGYEALPILKTVVPQLGHTPRVAGLPFFMVTG